MSPDETTTRRKHSISARLLSNASFRRASGDIEYRKACKTMTMSYNSDMASRANKPVTVTLGALTEMAQGHVASGRYASVSEVVRAGLRALEREEIALDALLKAKVEEALANPAIAIPQVDVFADLRAHHAKHASR